MRYAVLLIAFAAFIGSPALANNGKGKGPPRIDECEVGCLEDAAICLDAVKDELFDCLENSSSTWEECLAAAKAGAEICATEADACLTACDD